MRVVVEICGFHHVVRFVVLRVVVAGVVIGILQVVLLDEVCGFHHVVCLVVLGVVVVVVKTRGVVLGDNVVKGEYVVGNPPLLSHCALLGQSQYCALLFQCKPGAQIVSFIFPCTHLLKFTIIIPYETYYDNLI